MVAKSKYIPWVVVFLAFVATALSFLDRQVLSVSIIKIKEDFAISDTDYGFINTGFLISYAVMFTLGGILIDRYGSRWGLALSVGFWSLATVLHSVATNAFHFMSFRFLLGLGEGGAFPGAVKAVVEWVPKKRQALANGIAIGGAALGAVVAPPLCVYLIAYVGWRGVFVITGVFGFVWVVVWWLFTKDRSTYGNREEVVEGAATKFEVRDIVNILAIKEVWIFIIIRFVLDPIFYFYMFWIPKYLNEVQSIDLNRIGQLFWIPFLGLGISNILGGYLSDEIYKKTNSLNLARKSIMGIAALMTFSVLFVQNLTSGEWVIFMLFIAFFAHGFWITNYITAISDLFGKTRTSTIIGLSGSAGALSSLIINPLMGVIISKYTYQPLWIYAGSMYAVAFVFFIFSIPEIKSINFVKQDK
ncbi:MAG: MFS transporter [Saprospiraceae bacterium]|nr:MFS transporter [Saprospiraceae bacterium]